MRNTNKIRNIVIHELKPEEVRNTKLRKNLYHYTSPEGLYGMLSQGTVRFTDCQFLNDKSEYIHIRDVLFQALEELKLEHKINLEMIEIVQGLYNNNYETEEVLINQCVELNQKYRLNFASMRYYVFCTSMDEDSLSMWNYYVKSGNYEGYHIGFTNQDILNLFANASSEITLYHGQVNYSKDEQKQFLKNKLLLISDRMEQAKNHLIDMEQLDDFYDETQEEIYHLIQDYRLFFKNEKFSHEREYRFVLKVPRDLAEEHNDGIRSGFFLKHGIFSPYYDLSIQKSKTFKEIKIGPMLEFELAKDGLQRFLDYHNYNDGIHITQSVIPIRF